MQPRLAWNILTIAQDDHLLLVLRSENYAYLTWLIYMELSLILTYNQQTKTFQLRSISRLLLAALGPLGFHRNFVIRMPVSDRKQTGFVGIVSLEPSEENWL